jgi:hypothetical protein
METPAAGGILVKGEGNQPGWHGAQSGHWGDHSKHQPGPQVRAGVVREALAPIARLTATEDGFRRLHRGQHLINRPSSHEIEDQRTVRGWRNAQAMAAHESPRTTKLYDRTGDEAAALRQTCIR